MGDIEKSPRPIYVNVLVYPRDKVLERDGMRKGVVYVATPDNLCIDLFVFPKGYSPEGSPVKIEKGQAVLSYLPNNIDPDTFQELNLPIAFSQQFPLDLGINGPASMIESIEGQGRNTENEIVFIWENAPFNRPQVTSPDRKIGTLEQFEIFDRFRDVAFKGFGTYFQETVDSYMRSLPRNHPNTAA